MTRARVALAVTAAALLLTASLGAGASGRALSGGYGGVAIHRLGHAGSARSYWTTRRMSRAEPIDVLEHDAGDAARAPAGSPRVDPGAVAPSLPDGPIALASSLSPRSRTGGSRRPLASFSSGAVPTSDYRTYPFSTVGRVFFTDPTTNQNYACSGTAVSSPNESVVWTAGHCVHGGGTGESFYTNWVFVPSYVDHSRPAGTWPALVTMAPAQWISNGNLHYDMAAAVVAPLDGRRLTEVTGGRGIKWNQPQDETFTPYGYPAASPFNGERMRFCTSDLLTTADPPGGGPATLGVGCDMTQGSSGGGWIVGDQFLNSDVSYGIEGEPNVFYGPYFGDAAATLYDAASTSTLPGPLPDPTETPAGGPTPAPSATSPADATPTPAASPSPADDERGSSLTDVVDKPDPFTPNGDGVHDKVKLLFTLSEPSTVTITIFQPSGAPLGALVAGADAPQAARYKAKWNGKVGRKVVPKGTYGYAISAVDAHGFKSTTRGAVTVRP